MSQEETDRTLEALEPTVRSVERKLGADGDVRIYLQKPLSVRKKFQLGALIARLFQRASAEGGPGTVNEIMAMGSTLIDPDQDANDALEQAESFLLLAAAIGSWAPEFLTEFYILVLGVKDNQRDHFVKYLDENEYDGGFSDDEAVDVFTVFIKQNRERFTELFNLATGSLKKKKVATETETDPSPSLTAPAL